MTATTANTIAPPTPVRGHSGAGPTWRRFRPALLGALGSGLVIAAWALVVQLELVAGNAMPSPLAVGERVVDLLGDGEYWRAVQDTMWTWLLSMLIASAVMVPLGLVVGQVPALRRPVDVLANALRSIPATALVPVAILTFQLGTEMKLFLALYAMAWPVLINTVYGSRSVPPTRLDVSRTLRISRLEKYRKVILPSALPQIATGVRVAAGVSLVVILSAELLGARAGAGVLLRVYQQGEQPDFVYAGIFLIGMLGVCVFAVLDWAEAKLVRWEGV